MNLEHYGLVSIADLFEYHFHSDGTKGRIKKIIRFKKMKEGIANHAIYNLSFGDYDEGGSKMDDLVVSNNGDSKMILQTIARAVLIFIEQNPDAFIFARGSTSARTRLYCMRISSYYADIRTTFDLYGLVKNGGWELFAKNRPYKALLTKRKKCLP